MATSVIPALMDALIAQARAVLDDVEVYDGFGVSSDPGDFLMVGVDDPDAQDAASSAESEQSWANVGIGRQRDEEGTGTCAALSWNGDADAGRARRSAFATLAAVEDMLRADPTVTLGETVRTELGSSIDLTQQQDDGGASALLIFKVAFAARI